MNYLQSEGGKVDNLKIPPIELFTENCYKKYGEGPLISNSRISGIVKLNGFCVLKDGITVSSLFCFKSFFNHSKESNMEI